jgi:hypothetical protein
MDVVLPLQPSAQGGSGAFLARCSDGQRWWIKSQNQMQGGKVIVTENIVGRVGALVGAPVCDVAVVRIPSAIAGWEFRPGQRLVEGFAHASRDVPDVIQEGTLLFRADDDNARRHVGIYALYDWCWGGDNQWLYCTTDENRIHSHDHGWYLPDVGNDWTEASLTAQQGTTHELGEDHTGVDVGAVTDAIAALRTVTREDLAAILRDVPSSWPATDDELEAVGAFLEDRANDVADRLQARMGV